MGVKEIRNKFHLKTFQNQEQQRAFDRIVLANKNDNKNKNKNNDKNFLISQ